MTKTHHKETWGSNVREGAIEPLLLMLTAPIWMPLLLIWFVLSEFAPESSRLVGGSPGQRRRSAARREAYAEQFRRPGETEAQRKKRAERNRRRREAYQPGAKGRALSPEREKAARVKADANRERILKRRRASGEIV